MKSLFYVIDSTLAHFMGSLCSFFWWNVAPCFALIKPWTQLYLHWPSSPPGCFGLWYTQIQTQNTSFQVKLKNPVWWCAFLFQIAGVILVFAFSSLGNLVSFPGPVYSLMTRWVCIGKLGDLHKNQTSWMVCWYRVLICTVSIAVKSMVCVANSLTKSSMNNSK